MPSSSDSSASSSDPASIPKSADEPPTLQAKDRESIQRLIQAGAFRAAAKLYAGATDCGMRHAALMIKQLRSA